MSSWHFINIWRRRRDPTHTSISEPSKIPNTQCSSFYVFTHTLSAGVTAWCMLCFNPFSSRFPAPNSYHVHNSIYQKVLTVPPNCRFLVAPSSNFGWVKSKAWTGKEETTSDGWASCISLKTISWIFCNSVEIRIQRSEKICQFILSKILNTTVHHIVCSDSMSPQSLLLSRTFVCISWPWLNSLHFHVLFTTLWLARINLKRHKCYRVVVRMDSRGDRSGPAKSGACQTG